MRLLRFRQQGDTIVEVLIAIAVISLVLGGAYASGRRSFAGNQQAGERLEAAKFVEQQAERLKAKAKTEDAKHPVKGIFLPSPIDAFCLDANLDRRTDMTCDVGTDGRYHLEIKRGEDFPVGNPYIFTISTEWDSLGSGKDKVSIVYRVYPE